MISAGCGRGAGCAQVLERYRADRLGRSLNSLSIEELID